jgi:putative sulfotransferase
MERIVIGTGRCGSTLLSDLLSEHPQAAVLSEYMGSFHPEQGWPSDRDINGVEFARILSRWNGLGALYLNRGQTYSEILADVDAVAANKKKLKRIPTVTLVAMPFLSKAPEQLYAEFIAKAMAQPLQSLRRHFLDINGWLQNKFDKTFWIERTGMSTNMFREIHALFPDAQYVHIHRDGPECALSMQSFLDIALKVSYHIDPPSDEELELSLDLSLPPQQDPVLQRIQNPPAIEHFGRFWSYCIEKFFADMPRLRPEQLLTVTYEDLVHEPHRVLGDIARHFAMPDDPEWIDRAASRIRLPLRRRAEELPEAEYERLRKACLSGSILVGRDPGDTPFIDATLKLEAMIRSRDL